MNWIDWGAVQYFIRWCVFTGAVIFVSSVIYYAVAYAIVWIRKHI